MGGPARPKVPKASEKSWRGSNLYIQKLPLYLLPLISFSILLHFKGLRAQKYLYLKIRQ